MTNLSQHKRCCDNKTYFPQIPDMPPLHVYICRKGNATWPDALPNLCILVLPQNHVYPQHLHLPLNSSSREAPLRMPSLVLQCGVYTTSRNFISLLYLAVTYSILSYFMDSCLPKASINLGAQGPCLVLVTNFSP